MTAEQNPLESWQDILDAMPPWARKLAAMAGDLDTWAEGLAGPATHGTEDSPADQDRASGSDQTAASDARDRDAEDHERARGPHRRPPGGPPWAAGLDDPFGAALSRAFGGGRPWGRGRAKASRGDVRAAILALLVESSMHGYQLMQEMSQRSEGAWRPSPGSVYPTLSLLEDEGLVVSKDDAGRRVFTLTDEGREAATADDAEQAPWLSVSEKVDDRVAGLRKAAVTTASAVRAVGASGSPEQVDAAIKVLEDARRSLYRLLADG